MSQIYTWFMGFVIFYQILVLHSTNTIGFESNDAMLYADRNDKNPSIDVFQQTPYRVFKYHRDTHTSKYVDPPPLNVLASYNKVNNYNTVKFKRLHKLTTTYPHRFSEPDQEVENYVTLATHTVCRCAISKLEMLRPTCSVKVNKNKIYKNFTVNPPSSLYNNNNSNNNNYINSDNNTNNNNNNNYNNKDNNYVSWRTRDRNRSPWTSHINILYYNTYRTLHKKLQTNTNSMHKWRKTTTDDLDEYDYNSSHSQSNTFSPSLYATNSYKNNNKYNNNDRSVYFVTENIGTQTTSHQQSSNHPSTDKQMMSYVVLCPKCVKPMLPIHTLIKMISTTTKNQVENKGV